MLWQKSKDNEDKGVVMYASRMLTATEKKYHAYEKEALALVWSLDLLKHYLRTRFKVITDCRSLMYLKNNSNNTRVARWILRLQEFDFEIQHRPGRLSNDCDGMTRQPLQSAAPYGEDPAEPLYEETPHSSVFKQMESVGESVTLLPITRAAKRGEVPVQPAPEETKTKVSRKRKQQQEAAPVQQEAKSVQQEGKSMQQEAKSMQQEAKSVQQEARQTAPVEKRESAEEEGHAEPPFFKCDKDLQGWDLSTWLQEQSNRANEEIVKIKEHMHKTVLLGKQTKFCYTADGLLARKKEEEGYRDRIVVPESLKAFVLGQHHNLPLHAHQGREGC